MKRANNLYHNIYSLPNLELAYYKAAKGKQQQRDVFFFEKHLDVNLENLRQQIKNETFNFSNYSYFKIYDPKERVISVAPFSTRVLHHSIMNVCHSTFENQQIYHSYATRINKGTHSAIKKAVDNNLKYKWFLKLDVKKFFDTINHNLLKELLSKKFKEQKLLTLFGSIIDSYNTNKGLPIGNLTSQYFANFYLSFLDRYAKQTLKIKAYIRYMDDIIVWGKTKAEIWLYYCKLKEFLANNLKQTFKTPIFNKTQYPYNYLGYIIKNNTIHPNKRNKSKFIKKLKTVKNEISKNNISQEKASNQFWAMYQHQNFTINSYAK